MPEVETTLHTAVWVNRTCCRTQGFRARNLLLLATRLRLGPLHATGSPFAIQQQELWLLDEETPVKGQYLCQPLSLDNNVLLEMRQPRCQMQGTLPAAQDQKTGHSAGNCTKT